MAQKTKKAPQRCGKPRTKEIALSNPEMWTLALIAQHGDCIPNVLQQKGRRKKPERWSMSEGEVRAAMHSLDGKKFIARPEWCNVFTMRFFVTDKGCKRLEKHGLLPKKVVRKPVGKTAQKAAVGMW